MNGQSENAGAKLGEAAEQMKTSAENLTERGKEAASKLSAAMQTARTRIQEQTTASARATDRTIREHPYETVGIAFGVGLLIGVLIGRR